MGRSTRLFLVRHGQTTSNAIHALDTALPGASLTDLGWQQAAEAGQWLTERTQRLKIVSSFAARAQQTAVGVAGAFGGELVPASFSRGELLDDAAACDNATDHAKASLQRLPRVSEIPAGQYEMKNDEDSHEAYHSILGAWMLGKVDKAVPGGLSGAEVLREYLATLLGALAENQAENQAANAATDEAAADVALVSHGAVIRLVARFLGGVDPEWAFMHYLANGNVITLRVPDNIGELADVAVGRPGASQSKSAAGSNAAGATQSGVLDSLEGAFEVLGWGAATL